MMRYLFRFMLPAAVMLGAGSLAAQSYEPSDGDAVAVYINEFNPQDYEMAREIMVQGFGQAMTDSGQTRHTYWITNPDTYEVIGISFFKKGDSREDWHGHDGRQKVLEQLEPLRSKPQVRLHYQVIGRHNTSE
ncbi:MAG: hypothetical protein AAF530_15315 [Pseudomonadota bacterium]